MESFLNVDKISSFLFLPISCLKSTTSLTSKELNRFIPIPSKLYLILGLHVLLNFEMESFFLLFADFIIEHTIQTLKISKIVNGINVNNSPIGIKFIISQKYIRFSGNYFINNYKNTESYNDIYVVFD